jgi:protein-S-isoprenylcysteine O-methyltransferase Ste14
MRLIIPPILFLLCLGLMALLRWVWPITVVFPKPWCWLGLLSILVGLTTGAFGARQFIKAKTNFRTFKEADKLVTSGPFRYTRNPMYLGLLLCLVGAWILLRDLSPVLGVVIFLIVADHWYIQSEERMLRMKFGPDFENYCPKVRRWI